MYGEDLKNLHLKRVSIENELLKRHNANKTTSEEIIESEQSSEEVEEIMPSEEDRIKNDEIEARTILETTFGDSLKGYNIEIICK